ncbi:uncharacterized protein EV422DRAFT_535830 [Fimicolochytrium jonesii]|uniref:uncharacterized protein n=1 Tax=Fimicolochytrium jonesii TaxID=1396493 RepID=UPI0022FF1EDB|nr:uncharacterized protein EV422DRAFT_535830 [Fimicolochytrium jonesii]KAI8818894.1 hypothetical protein EV422DRAFT_535830 [Fimicolochytrium jonesii]
MSGAHIERFVDPVDGKDTVKTNTHWYLELNPVYIDLVGDFAGTELFVVDGEALLALVYEDLAGVDCPAFLHALYCAEERLKALIDVKANFELAFFDDRRNLSANAPEGAYSKEAHWRRLFRSALVAHLRNNTGLRVNLFASVCTEDWVSYVAEKKPYFIFTNDGGSAEDESTDQVSIRERKLGKSGQTLWLESMYLFLQQGLSVALLARDSFQGNRVVAFVFHTHARFTDGDPSAHHQQYMSSAAFLNDNSIKSITDACDAAIHLEGSLLVATLSKIITPDPLSVDMAKLFLLHSVILPQIPLEYRALQDIRLPLDSKALSSYEDFVRSFYATAEQTTLKFGHDTEPLLNTVDERFFRCLVFEVGRHLNTNPGSSLRAVLGDLAVENANRIKTAWEAIFPGTEIWSLSSEFHDSIDARAFSVPQKDGLSSPPTDDDYSLLPYDQPFLKSYLPTLPTESEAASPQPNFEDVHIRHHETTHWHVNKPVATTHGPNPVHSAQKAAVRARKADQRHAKFIQDYASSLTGATGGVIKRKTIVCSASAHGNKSATPRKALESTHTSSPKTAKAGGKKGTPLSKKDAIIAANNERKLIAEREPALNKWKQLQRNSQKHDDVEAAIAELDRSLQSDARAGHAVKFITDEKRLYKAMLLLQKWASLCVGEDEADVRRQKEGGMGLLVQIFEICTELVHGDGTSGEVVDEARGVLDTIGLSPSASGTSTAASTKEKGKSKKSKASKENGVDSTPSTPSKDKKDKKHKSDKPNAVSSADVDPSSIHALSFTFKYPKLPRDKTALRCPYDVITFQLKHFGPYMERNVDSAPDVRTDFMPDRWQRDVLDCIDRDESLFIVAPTSAGKTFIAFYAIEKVLRESNEGVVVYVAPTKALVNQIAAEISARFTKTYPHPGMSVWAVHTRDYRIHNPLKCQVLITVPHMLQIFLMQPDVAAHWTPRLKRIIFDEIHTISNLEGGVVWEQNLLLSPCSIIALSATVGNPEDFGNWLREVQDAKGHSLRTIRHSHRYSDLRKFIYLPTSPQSFNGLKEPSLEGVTNFQHIHPVAALSLGASTIPDDMYLEPFECLQLYDLMKKEEHDAPEQVPVDLDPQRYFARLPKIRKIDVVNYQTELKAVLQAWMGVPGSRKAGPFFRVLKQLTRDLDQKLLVQEFAAERNGAPTAGFDYALKNVTALCADLHRSGKLPAILFNYSRNNVEMLALRIHCDLVAAETKFKETDTSWKRKVEDWKNWKALEAARHAAAAKTTKSSKSRDDDDAGDDGGDDMGDLLDWHATFDPDAPLPQYSFAGKSSASASEIEKEIDHLRNWVGIPEQLCDALLRGIGVHHSGMNVRYRQFVERHARSGNLRVVVATGTLALGINLPAATSVFTEDSVFLTALEYRQAAGRAGRRGFDVLGNVVFFAIPIDKVYRLLASRLSDLSGHFPLSTTLVLRLHQLLVDGEAKNSGEEMMKGMLGLGRLSVGSPAARLEVLHHLRFSIDYLRRVGLLDSTGHPVNLAGVAAHLYWTEPMNFAFVYLMDSGILKDIACGPEPELNLLTCLAHLFARRKRPTKIGDFKEEIIKKSPSKVFLEPLPSSAVDALKHHNDLLFQVLRSYIHTFIKTLPHEETATLPVSNRTFAKSASQLAPSLSSAPLVQSIASTHSLAYRARSPFVALSGLGDSFTTIEEMCTTLRAGISLQHAVIPMVTELVDTSPTAPILDAYAVDFYRHGQFKALIDGNGIRRGDVWFFVNDFMLIIGALRTGLEVLLKAYEKKVTGDVGSDGAVDDEDEDEDDIETVASGPPTAAGAVPPGKKASRRQWIPPQSFKVRDDRLWDTYLVMCNIQRGFIEKMEIMDA